MPGEFFSKEFMLGDVAGGGLLYTGAEVVNNGISGMLNVSGAPRLTLESIVKVLEGYGFSVAAEKMGRGLVRNALEGASLITPGTVPFDLVNYAVKSKYGSGLKDLSYAKGLSARGRVLARVTTAPRTA